MDERSPKQETTSGPAPSPETPMPKAPTPETLAGWCEAASRLLTPLLGSPQVKARLRILFQHVDPDYAPVLVRTLFRTDPEIPLAALSALPRLGNLLIEAAAETTRAVGAFPPALLGSVAAGLLTDLRPRPLGEALGRALRLVRSLPLGGSAPAQFWAELVAGFSAGYGSPTDGLGMAQEPSALAAHAEGLAAAVAAILASNPELATSATKALGESLARHPALLREGLVPLLTPLHEALHTFRSAEGESR